MSGNRQGDGAQKGEEQGFSAPDARRLDLSTVPDIGQMRELVPQREREVERESLKVITQLQEAMKPWDAHGEAQQAAFAARERVNTAWDDQALGQYSKTPSTGMETEAQRAAAQLWLTRAVEHTLTLDD
ncbi:MAG: hypothetical protein J2P36_06750, partial [Ktedonobacteraceae bacterium]|nr:hypothetical protein [Ktedonobacteraceae bacterium]